MIKQKVNTAAVYGALFLVIGIWWHFTLRPSSSDHHTFATLPSPQLNLHDTFPKIFPYLSQMDRALIHQALLGDEQLMKQLIEEWDVDAEILKNHKIPSIKRLARNRYIQGQIIARKLAKKQMRHSRHLETLPQTFQATSYSLALLTPDKIIGLPKGVRDQTVLYPKKMTNEIPLTITAYNCEKINQKHPQLAIVSKTFTDPCWIHTLLERKIPLIAERDIKQIQDIPLAIREIGHAIGSPSKADLLAIFVEAALIAIDNRLLAIHHLSDDTQELSAVYLNYHNNYSLPTSKSLTGQLLDRIAKIFPSAIAKRTQPDTLSYFYPIEQEQLILLNPECLIVSTQSPCNMWRHLSTSKAMQQISAIRNRNVFFVDETTQHVTDQHITLAYYDLACKIMNAVCKKTT